MKISSIFIILPLLAILTMTTGCKPKVPKIGILIHSYENERWIKDKNYMVENLTRLGAEVMVEEAGGDQNKQFTQAQEMVKKGAKVLIVAAANSDQASRIVDMAHESKVKVIAYDRLINGCKLDYYISANSTQIGELMTSYVTSLKPEGKYALIPGSKYDNNAQRIFLGQMNVLQPYMESGDIQVVYSEFTEAWTTAEGELHTKRILEQNPDITAIIAGSDAITNGVLKVLKENGLENKVFVTGQDAEIVNVKNVMNGTQTCDILKPLKEMAQVTAELAMDVAQDKPITIKFTTESNGKSLVKSVLLEAIVVNKNNVQSTVISSGFHTAAELN